MFLVRLLAAIFVLSVCSSSWGAGLDTAYETCKHGTNDDRIAACGEVIDQVRDKTILLRAYNTRGLALCDLDRCDQAVEDFNHVIRLNPKIAGYFDNRARALRAAKRFSEAMADSEHAIAMAPTYAFVYLGKAHALEDQDRFDDALQTVDLAMQIERANAGVYEYRGKILGELKRFDEAYAAFNQAMQIQPARPSVYRTRGDVEYAEGKLDSALADYERYPSDGKDIDAVSAAMQTVRSTLAEQQAAAAREAAEQQARSEREAEARRLAQEREAEAERRVQAERASDEQRRADLQRQLDDARRDAEEARRQADQARREAATSIAKPPTITVNLVDPTTQAAKPSQPSDTISKEDADRLNKSLGELSAQIKALNGALEEQKRLKSAAGGDVESIDATITLVERQIQARQREYDSGQSRFSRYITSVKPQDRDEYTTARVASQAFPRVPYFIPGTQETGEFWIEPIVSETGTLTYQFRFVDPTADYNKVRDTIAMSPSELVDVQAALTKIRAWSLKHTRLRSAKPIQNAPRAFRRQIVPQTARQPTARRPPKYVSISTRTARPLVAYNVIRGVSSRATTYQATLRFYSAPMLHTRVSSLSESLLKERKIKQTLINYSTKFQH